MLDRLKTLFEQPPAEPSVDAVHLAAAALLMRAAQIDGQIDAHEQSLLERIIAPNFGLNAEEAAALLQLAKQEADTANDLFRWTNVINQHFEYPHKVRLIELLWQLVLADGVVDDYESNLLRRVAGLIHVSDRDAALARQAAKDTA